MNLLVVDDDIDLCRMVSRFLEKNGLRVHSAQDALQALDVLERESIEMIITDYQMPHMDGIQFAAQVRADPRFQRIPVIMMTGQYSDELVDGSMRKGVAMTMAKPLDLKRLLTLVRFAQ